jgi:NADPH2:quinone reductase
MHSIDQQLLLRLESMPLAELSAGEVMVRVQYSGINYKDALAAAHLGRIMRRYPLNGGVDLAGVVAASSVAQWREGDAVLVTGCGLSETRDGGYSEYARVPADAVVALPPGFDARRAMAVGTAGYAAALAIMRMEHNGQQPAQGPVVVTGASGGVGSLAIAMLCQRGYEAIAVSGKAAAREYLRSLGASQVWGREELGAGTPAALLSARWAGAIDNLGGTTLARLLAGTQSGGNVASVGLAESSELTGTVMPFILRGVNLLGINSGASVRDQVWQRIATDLCPKHLDTIVQREVTLDELPAAFAALLQGTVMGRVLVRIS